MFLQPLFHRLMTISTSLRLTNHLPLSNHLESDLKGFYLFTDLFFKNIKDKPSVFIFLNYTQLIYSWGSPLKLNIIFNKNQFLIGSLKNFKLFEGEGVIYLRALFLLFFIDACLTDDEPIWEPVEWSLIQSWILFIFIFSWIAENLITSRFGSYTGRDKRVWFSWYKMFWVVYIVYLISLGSALLFVVIPFYYEISTLLPLVLSWWDWYTRVFFAKFLSIYVLIILISYFLQLNARVMNWKKLLLLVIFITLFISYLLYMSFYMSFFAYITDPNWYHKTRLVDYVQLSHEPNKWSWGNAKRDHFSYHKSSQIFWFKNDAPFAEAFLLIHVMFFLSLFAILFYWLVLLRRIYATQEYTYTYLTYSVSTLKQFFYLFLFFFFFIFFSFLLSYLRLPFELYFLINTTSWLLNLLETLLNYFSIFLN